MAELKTKPTHESVTTFLDGIRGEDRRRDCQALAAMMREVAGQPRMWGSSIVGFGSYDYRYASGRSGTWFLTGFSPRKQALTVYLALDLDEQSQALGALGKHRRGKSCLYIKRLSDVDMEVLRGLVHTACSEKGASSCGGSH